MARLTTFCFIQIVAQNYARPLPKRVATLTDLSSIAPRLLLDWPIVRPTHSEFSGICCPKISIIILLRKTKLGAAAFQRVSCIIHADLNFGFRQAVQTVGPMCRPGGQKKSWRVRLVWTCRHHCAARQQDPTLQTRYSACKNFYPKFLHCLQTCRPPCPPIW